MFARIFSSMKSGFKYSILLFFSAIILYTGYYTWKDWPNDSLIINEAHFSTKTVENALASLVSGPGLTGLLKIDQLTAKLDEIEGELGLYSLERSGLQESEGERLKLDARRKEIREELRLLLNELHDSKIINDRAEAIKALPDSDKSEAVLSNLAKEIRKKECRSMGEISEQHRCSQIDHILDNLRQGIVEYTWPSKMLFGKQEVIQVSISSGRTQGESKIYLRPEIQRETEQEEVERLTRTIGAGITSVASELEFAPSGITKRLVSNSGPNIWKWHIKPKAFGEKKILTIDIEGYLEIEGKLMPPHWITSIDIDTSVFASWHQRLIYRLRELNNVWTALAGIFFVGYTIITWFIFRNKGAHAEQSNVNVGGAS